MRLLFFMAHERDDDDNDITSAINSMGSEKIMRSCRIPTVRKGQF